MNRRSTSVVQTRWRSGLGNLGPFVANYTVQATPVGGVASPASPSSRSGRQALDVELHLSFDVDLATILPELRLPSASIEIPGHEHVATPGIQVAWPTVTVRLSHRDRMMGAHEPGSNPASLLAAIALAVSDAILDVPFGAPLLAVALDGVLTSVGVDGATTFLQTIVSSLAGFPGAIVPRAGSISQSEGASGGVDPIPADYASESQHGLTETAWA